MTIREIADLLDVSPSTVSIVLNGKPGVSDKTRCRVLDALKKYGYGTERVRRSNNSGKNIYFLKYSTTGLLVDKNDGFVSEIIDATEVEVRKNGYNLVLTSITDQNLENSLRHIKASQTAGLILLGTELFKKSSYFLTNLDIPLVIIDNYMPSYNINCVVMNNKEIVKQSVQYLYDLGHRSIGHVGSSVHITNFEERDAAFHEKMQELSLKFNPKHEYYVVPNITLAYEEFKNILKNKPSLPTALFCNNDSIAIGVIRALKEYGYHIPHDISIIGLDDIPSASLIDPPLTTTKIYRIDIGKWSIQLLMDAIHNPHPTPAKVLTSGKFKIRDSVAPPHQK